MMQVARWFWTLGPANPMVLRIVYGGSRRLRHFFVRTGYLAVLVGLVILAMLSSGNLSGSSVSLSDLAKSGSVVFTVIAYAQVIGVCLLAPVFMAGAIASEQSGRTYNILLTTPMSNLQIVLGSLLGRLFFVLALLLSGLPLFAVLLVFGGVRSAAVFQAFAIAGFTALFVGSVAIALSVLRAGGRKTVVVFVIAIAAFLVGAYLADRVVLRPMNVQPYTTWLTPVHPLLVLESMVLTTGYSPVPEASLAGATWLERWWLGRPFETFVALSVGGSVVLMSVCAVVLRRMGQGAGSLPAWLAKLLRVHHAERSRPPRDVRGNPIAWREANTRGKFFAGISGRYGFVLLSIAGTALLLWLYHTGKLANLSALGGSEVDALHGLLTAVLMLQIVVIALVAVYMSSGCVSKEREDGTLDIFLTTPITPRQYIWGKLRGLVRFLGVMIAAPVLTLGMVGAYTLAGQFMSWPGAQYVHAYLPSQTWNSGNTARVTMDASLVLPESAVLLALMLVPFVALCVAAGMWRSLGSKTVLGALVPVVVVGGVVLAVVSWCGFAAAENVPLLGPALSALSPLSGLLMLVNPYENVSAYQESVLAGRVSLWVSSAIAAAAYGGVVYAMIAAMVAGFDQTVRKLSGTG